MPDRLSRLVDAINRVGIRNVSLLSRLTGIPTETVRYTLNQRFPELGLSVGLSVDYDRLGLERKFAILEFASGDFDYAPELLSRLAKVAFLTYSSREILRPRYVATFGVPITQEEKFRSFLKTLVRGKVLFNFRLEGIEWTRHLALRSEYYDFKNKRWNIDWNRVEALKEAPPAPPITTEPSPRPDLDTIDLLLVKELELQSWRNISEIARKLRLNDRTVRWHYTGHVLPMISSYFVRRLPLGSEGLTKLVGLIQEFRGLSPKKLASIRRLFNNFPFTWNEGGRKDGYYLTVSTIPSEQLVESLQFLTPRLQKEVSSWETYALDLSSSYSYTIPYENFDDKVGWFFNHEEAINTILAVRSGKKYR